MARASRLARLPKAVEASIESLSPEGRGVARVDGRVVFVDGALPGETVRVVFTRLRRDFAEGVAAEILQPAPERVAPRCAHFAICGGCALQHLDPAAQIHLKSQQLIEQLRRIGRVEPAEVWPPLTGPLWAYRHKARLGVKWVSKKGRVLVGFREKASALLADLHHCPVLHPAVGENLDALGTLVASLDLRERIPQIEVAVGDVHRALVFRILDDLGAADAGRLADFGAAFGFDMFVQRQGPDSVVAVSSGQSAPLGYALDAFDVHFAFQPGEFTQVNPQINRDLVARAVALLDPGPEDDVLDLFCGLGNFTLPLARSARHVAGVEGSVTLVERARENAQRNGLTNVAYHVADLSQPLTGQDWAARRYAQLLLDPSRVGAREVLEYIPIWQPRRIVYVSCNPATLARDAGYLVRDLGYRLAGAGVLDMFPHTTHVESIALFERAR